MPETKTSCRSLSRPKAARTSPGCWRPPRTVLDTSRQPGIRRENTRSLWRVLSTVMQLSLVVKVITNLRDPTARSDEVRGEHGSVAGDERTTRSEGVRGWDADN